MSEIYLSDDDVVSMTPKYNFAKTPTSKVKEIKQALTSCLSEFPGWTGNGLDCQVLLQQGGGWQKGVVRLRIEFTPNDPVVQENPKGVRYTLPNSQSPLDDLRSELDV